MRRATVHLLHGLAARQMTGENLPVTVIENDLGQTLAVIKGSTMKMLYERLIEGVNQGVEEQSYYLDWQEPQNIGSIHDKTPCPSCGCVLYREVGPCAGSLALSDLQRATRR